MLSYVKLLWNIIMKYYEIFMLSYVKLFTWIRNSRILAAFTNEVNDVKRNEYIEMKSP